jgi:Asp-tRNA(Asn)/Glu-tRNA(Gln) amidotransferase A subunit family amidase
VNPTRLPAHALAAAIRRRELGPEEVVDAYAARIEALDEVLNAFVDLRLADARVEARALDAALRHGEEVGPLAGVPFSAKEAIASAGLSYANGSRLRAGRRAPADAGAVARLRAAGAIQLGVTNVSEFCAHYDTDNLLHGRTANPHDPARTPGGSSGGEAAAVAAGLSALGLGSDLGSSIRQPAAWCGVFGLRPSRGAVSSAGHDGFGLSPAFRYFGTIGPLGRSAADLELALPVIAHRPLPGACVRRLRVAVYEEDGLQPVAAACRAAVREAAASLAAAGHELVEAAPPAASAARRVFDTMLVAELRTLALPELEGREDQLSPPLRALVDDLRRFPADLHGYLDAAREREALEQVVDAWFEATPIALCPAVPVPAPIAAEGIVLIDGQPARPGGKMTLATYANVFGLPSVSVPAGRDADGLPLAVLVTGRRDRDCDVLAVARTLEEALGGWVDPESA